VLMAAAATACSAGSSTSPIAQADRCGQAIRCRRRRSPARPPTRQRIPLSHHLLGEGGQHQTGGHHQGPRRPAHRGADVGDRRAGDLADGPAHRQRRTQEPATTGASPRAAGRTAAHTCRPSSRPSTDRD
jgi:hypothetical protein